MASNKMIGRGTPNIQRRIPRPMTHLLANYYAGWQLRPRHCARALPKNPSSRARMCCRAFPTSGVTARKTLRASPTSSPIPS